MFQEELEAHVGQLVELVPRQRCLSQSETAELHTGLLSQVLVRGAALGAQAQLRLECLHRYWVIITANAFLLHLLAL